MKHAQAARSPRRAAHRDGSAGWRTPRWAALAVAAATVLTFWQVQSFDFVNWSDDRYVYENPLVRSFAPRHVAAWFTRPAVSMYVPLTLATYAVDYQLYGMKASGYHRTSLLLHASNAVLVFVLLNSFFRDVPAAALGALLFGVHPAQVESVAWLSERKTLLFAFFFLAGFLAVVRAASGRGLTRRTWAVASLCFLASLLSKPAAVVIPAILVAYDYFWGNVQGRRRWVLYGALGVLVLAVSVLTVALYPKSIEALAKMDASQWAAERVATFGVYLRNAFYPVGLVAFPLPPATGPLGLPAGFALAAAFAGLALAARKRLGAAFWALWFLLWLFPVAGVFDVPVRDRHLYLPLVGCVGLALDLLARWRRVRLVTLAVAVAVAVPISLAGLGKWRNGETLWTTALAENPTSHVAKLHLGNYYDAHGAPERAIGFFKDTFAAHPEEPYAYINLAMLYLRLNRVGEAEAVVAQFGEHHADRPDRFSLAAAVAKAKGDEEQTVALLRKAIDAGSRNPADPLNLGRLLATQGRFEEAVEWFRRAAQLGEESAAQCFFDMGLALLRLERWQDAVQAFKRVPREAPFPGLHFHRGYAHLRAGDIKGAKQEFHLSVTREPRESEAFYHLGLLALAQGEPEEARRWLQEAVRLKPEAEPYQDALKRATHAT